MTAIRAIVLMTTLAMLPASSAPSTSSFHVEVVGRGRPMLLIPGLSSSGDAWKTTVARYQERFQCHIVTLAGFAGVPPITTPLIATARAEIADYIRSQHLDHPIVI